MGVIMCYYCCKSWFLGAVAGPGHLRGGQHSLMIPDCILGCCRVFICLFVLWFCHCLCCLLAHHLDLGLGKVREGMDVRVPSARSSLPCESGPPTLVWGGGPVMCQGLIMPCLLNMAGRSTRWTVLEGYFHIKVVSPC